MLCNVGKSARMSLVLASRNRARQDETRQEKGGGRTNTIENEDATGVLAGLFLFHRDWATVCSNY